MTTTKPDRPIYNAWIPATNFTPAKRRPSEIRWLVLHSTESTERTGGARAVAQWTFGGPNARRASTHAVVDNTDTIQCVREHDVSWSAGGANRYGLHVELVGKAAQSAADWSDPYSAATIAAAAALVGEWCITCKIEPVWLTATDLATGARGITSHAEISKWHPSTGHTDPGPNFPKDRFLKLVRAHINARKK